MQNNQKWLTVGLIGLVLVCLCAGAVVLAFGGLAVFNIRRVQSQVTPRAEVTLVATATPLPAAPSSTGPQETPTVETPALVSPTTQAGAAGPAQAGPGSQGAQETLRTLEESVVPINDPRDMAQRLEGIKNIPVTMTPPAQPLSLDAAQTFWASNVDTNENFKVNAHLRYITDHLYFWVQDGVSYDPRALKQLCDTFEEKIYPTDRAFFGSEWSPGIDGDVHLYVLFARGMGNNIAGYFSSADELPPQAHPYSNAHEMFILNADVTRIGDPYIFGTMAHEFQHMIHWYRDRNEESWMNEGFSVLAQFLNGYDTGGFDSLYVTNPDLQLTDWPSPPLSTPHYGESFLFLDYFLSRFGEKATQALVGNPDNGMDSIDETLATLKAADPRTGKLMTADDVFADWAVTSYLNNAQVGDGRYVYQNYPAAPKTQATQTITDCASAPLQGSVFQYGIDFIRIACSGNYTLQFKGNPEVNVLPASPHSGKYAFWSNKGDESDMTLTRTFDFSQTSGQLTLQYAIWYDLEKDYDYAYLEVSEDGTNWQILKTPSGRDKSLDPSGNSYGWGYNGQSGGWREESVDLSQYAGKKVQIRFEYVTDAAVNNNGLMIDDIQIPQAGYSEDFEKGDGGWQGKGFVRIQNRLPQLFRVELITEGQTVTVQDITLDANDSAAIPLQLGGENRDVVLVVSGVTRFTTQEAGYEFSFQP